MVFDLYIQFNPPCVTEIDTCVNDHDIPFNVHLRFIWNSYNNLMSGCKTDRLQSDAFKLASVSEITGRKTNYKADVISATCALVFMKFNGSCLPTKLKMCLQINLAVININLFQFSL